MFENAKWMQELCCIFNAFVVKYIDNKMENFSFMGQRYMHGNGSKSAKFNNL